MLLSIDSQTLQTNFPARPFTMGHQLTAHPLFRLERVLELGRALPAEEIEYNAGDLAVSQDAKLTPRNGLSVEETISRIRDCKSWMVLKHIEHDSEYRALLYQCLDEVRQAAGLDDMHQREGFLFLSSPNSVTPYHMDPENNFLLQIQGTKTVYMWDPQDRTVLSEKQLEHFYGAGGHRNMPFQPEWQERAKRFDLHPGDAVYFPPTAPHWVQNGPDVSVSFSITFRSEVADRRQRVYWVNNRLRSLGVEPRPFGSTPLIDSAKNLAVQTAGKARRVLNPNGE
jgi:hypothetical protein